MFPKNLENLAGTFINLKLQCSYFYMAMETNIKDSHKFNATTCLQLSLKMEQEVAFELFNLRAASKLDVDFSKVLNDLISEQTASQFKLQQHLHSLQLMAAHAKDQGLSEFLFDQSL
uniref:Ferritin n=1 Tax=Ciona savignyi TaxID=51511 RepID=H2ZH69_CIOSA